MPNVVKYKTFAHENMEANLEALKTRYIGFRAELRD
jgi:hypothetical protein